MIRRLLSRAAGDRAGSHHRRSPLGSAIAIMIPTPTDRARSYPTAFPGPWAVLAIVQRAAQGSRAAGPDRRWPSSPSCWFLDRTLLGQTVKAGASQSVWPGSRASSPKLRLHPGLGASAAVLSTLSMILIGGRGLDRRRLPDPRPQHAGRRPWSLPCFARLRSFRATVLAAVWSSVWLKASSTSTSSTSPALGRLSVLRRGPGGRVAAVAGARRRVEAAFSFTPPAETIPARLKAMFWVRHLDRAASCSSVLVAAVAPAGRHRSRRACCSTPRSLAFAICACRSRC